MINAPKIVGYQVQDDHGNHWADRPSFLILSEKTAVSDLSRARMGEGVWLMIAIMDGDIEEPEYENGFTDRQAQVDELVRAAKPLSELLFDDHKPGKIFSLQVDGGEVTRLRHALAPFSLAASR